MIDVGKKHTKKIRATILDYSLKYSFILYSLIRKKRFFSSTAGFEPAIFWSVVRRVIRCATRPLLFYWTQENILILLNSVFNITIILSQIVAERSTWSSTRKKVISRICWRLIMTLLSKEEKIPIRFRPTLILERTVQNWIMNHAHSWQM